MFELKGAYKFCIMRLIPLQMDAEQRRISTVKKTISIFKSCNTRRNRLMLWSVFIYLYPLVIPFLLDPD